MSLLFNILSRFVIAFLPRSKCLLISWFQSPSTVILEPKKIWQHSFSVFIWALPVVVMVVGCMSCSLGASASVSPSNEYSELISFRINWFDLLAVQGTLKSLLQHHSLKTSVLQCSAFIVQLSHPYTTTGKTSAVTRRPLLAK